MARRSSVERGSVLRVGVERLACAKALRWGWVAVASKKAQRRLV